MSARTLDQLRKDLQEYARLAEVRYDPAIADGVRVATFPGGTAPRPT